VSSPLDHRSTRPDLRHSSRWETPHHAARPIVGIVHCRALDNPHAASRRAQRVDGPMVPIIEREEDLTCGESTRADAPVQRAGPAGLAAMASAGFQIKRFGFIADIAGPRACASASAVGTCAVSPSVTCLPAERASAAMMGVAGPTSRAPLRNRGGKNQIGHNAGCSIAVAIDIEALAVNQAIAGIDGNAANRMPLAKRIGHAMASSVPMPTSGMLSVAENRGPRQAPRACR
jgi:hypothetical protein